MILFAAATLAISNARYIKYSSLEATFLVKPTAHFQFISRSPSKMTLGRMEDVVEPHVRFRGSDVGLVVQLVPENFLDTADSRVHGELLSGFRNTFSKEKYLQMRHKFLLRLKAMDKKKRAAQSQNFFDSGSDSYWTQYRAIWANKLILYAENSKWALSVVLLGGTQLHGRAAYDDARREMLTIRPTPEQYRLWSKMCPLKTANKPPRQPGG